MQKFLDETGEIFRNPDASQNDIARSMDVCGNNSGIPEKVGERGIYQKRDGCCGANLVKKKNVLWDRMEAETKLEVCKTVFICIYHRADFLEVIGEVIMPLLLSNIIDKGVIGGRGISYIVTMGIIMIVTALFMMTGGVGGAYFAIKASTGFNIDQYNTGSLITRLTNDITQIQNMIQMMLRLALRAPGMLIGALNTFAVPGSLL